MKVFTLWSSCVISKTHTVGTLNSEDFILSTLTSSDPQKHTPFDLRPWEKLHGLCSSAEIVPV